MDFDRLQRIFGRLLETHGMVFGGALSAIIVLIVLVALTRRQQNKTKMPKQPKHKKSKKASGKKLTEIDGTDDLVLDDDISMTLEIEDETDPINMADNTDLSNMGAALPDELSSDRSDQFAHLDDDTRTANMDELDDITIPQVGQAPPPQKSRFFSSAWLTRDKNPAPVDNMTSMTNDITFTPEDAKTRASAAECARLAEIERKMLALGELYEAGLIAPEVYVLKARELAHQV